MTKTKIIGGSLTVCGILCGLLSAQEPAVTAVQMPVYHFTVTSRTVKAVNYQHHRGSTKVDFRGTDILPNAHGEAKVEGKAGYLQIEAEFDGLQPATKNGAEYLTYVLWAITPEGRTANLGELLLNGDKSKLHVTTELQSFGLVVTAEPYYAVTQPSGLIVMENVMRSDTKGQIEEIDAKYELFQQGQYRSLANPLALKLDRKQPLELYEARNAVQIARAEGADRFASETFLKATNSLAQAEAEQDRHAGNKSVVMTARAAVQTAEDSRAIAVKRQEQDALAAERQQSIDREARAQSERAAAQAETDRVTREAEAARIAAQNETDRLTREAEAARIAAQNETDRLTREAEAARIAAQNETDRLTREKDAQAVSAQTEADRVKSENDDRLLAAAADVDRLKAESAANAATAAAEIDRLKSENATNSAASQASLDDLAKQTAQLQAEKVELRAQLLSQFNAILQTRDTARGLIVNMSDVLFDTGKFSLRPQAREKLAKVAGIVAGHPGLRLAVEGHTDNVGGDDYNQQLSEQRGESVRDYLTGQGMADGSVTSRGFGKTQPVASNETVEGRQQNRRVELVVSGELIGTQIGTPIAAIR
jgi:outer membrane protein OmpA-like peptidoglycan-associated protein